MRALVSGAGGFVGGHLVAHLREWGDQVVGLVRPGSRRPEGIECREADVLEAEAVEAVVRKVEPEAVYHLAGLPDVAGSWHHRRRTLETNLLGTLSILEAVRVLGLGTRVLLVGSSEQYGQVPEAEQPIRERAPLRPVTPYGVSKAAQELLGLQYASGEGLPVLLVRSFNHAGPGQPAHFVISEWARAIAQMEAGVREPVLEVGNLEVERDFTDVRDVVRLYRLVMREGRVAEPYNACSGVRRPLREVLRAFQSLSRVAFRSRSRAGSLRRRDLRLVVGSLEKVRRELGWEPRIPFEETLGAVLEHWRARIGSAG